MSRPKVSYIGVIMIGVTGGMGTNLHLIRSIRAIQREGDIKCADGDTIVPDPILAGRNSNKLEELTKLQRVQLFTTVLDTTLAAPFPYNIMYFDAQIASRRADADKSTIAAGKQIYCEKPTTVSIDSALEFYGVGKKAGIENGIVEDKLWLPGLVKMQTLIKSGFFGEILSVRGKFRYWILDGETAQPQRPS